MKFKVFQPTRDTINNEKVWFEIRFDGNVTPEIFSERFHHVADIDCNGLNEVFEIGNIGPESSITRHNPMSSISVGDVIIDEENVAHVVKRFGFEALAEVA